MLPSLPSKEIGILQPSNLLFASLTLFSSTVILLLCLCVRLWTGMDACSSARAGVFSAGERGPVAAGKLITHSFHKFDTLHNDVNVNSRLCASCPPAVDVLRGGISHMCDHRHPVCGPHAHHWHVLLCVSMLWELWWGNAPETEKERWLSERFLHCFAHRHIHLHHVSCHGLPYRCYLLGCFSFLRGVKVSLGGILFF